MPPSTLRPYVERDYSRTLNCMRELISKYNHHCATAEDPSEDGLAGILRVIAIYISELINCALSEDAATEYTHLSQLDRMSKQLLQIDEKSVCQEIWTLIDRKSKFLESTPLAKPLPRAAYGQGAWIQDDLHGWRASVVDDFFDSDDVNSMDSDYEEAPIRITFQPRRSRQPVTLMSEGRVNETNMAVLRDAINVPSAADENLLGATSSVPELIAENRQHEEPYSAQPSVRLEDLITNYNLIDRRSSGANNPPARLSTWPSPSSPRTPRLRSAVADFDIVERAPPMINQPHGEPTESEGEAQGAGVSEDIHWSDGTEHA
ncbi:MAG: hypothetical protein Q9212_002207 [Teloschistes hypoglaucus]